MNDNLYPSKKNKMKVNILVWTRLMSCCLNYVCFPRRPDGKKLCNIKTESHISHLVGVANIVMYLGTFAEKGVEIPQVATSSHP